MEVRTITAKRILTRQKRGFLAEGVYPFTHTLSWAVGCGFGKTTCGLYCYAQHLPNWHYNRDEDQAWGDLLIIKENAPELLENELAKSRSRATMRIFMSSVTDPYQPIERKYRMTRQCLQVFSRYADLDLLVIQTRSPFAADDFDLIASIPYAWLSITVETDRGDLPYGPNAAFIRQRLETVQAAVNAGIPTQIAVAPCLPHSESFAATLMQTGAQRVVVDTFNAGDGSEGQRTGNSPFATLADYNWRDSTPARALHKQLQQAGMTVGWSLDGFSGIPPRKQVDSHYLRKLL